MTREISRQAFIRSELGTVAAGALASCRAPAQGPQAQPTTSASPNPSKGSDPLRHRKPVADQCAYCRPGAFGWTLCPLRGAGHRCVALLRSEPGAAGCSQSEIRPRGADVFGAVTFADRRARHELGHTSSDGWDMCVHRYIETGMVNEPTTFAVSRFSEGETSTRAEHPASASLASD